MMTADFFVGKMQTKDKEKAEEMPVGAIESSLS